MNSDHQMVEPVPAPEMLASGLAKIQDIGGGCLRLNLYVMQAPIEATGPAERVIVVKVIVPASALADAVLQMTEAANRKPGKLGGLDRRRVALTDQAGSARANMWMRATLIRTQHSP
jgi:hypothetical protein